MNKFETDCKFNDFHSRFVFHRHESEKYSVLIDYHSIIYTSKSLPGHCLRKIVFVISLLSADADQARYLSSVYSVSLVAVTPENTSPWLGVVSLDANISKLKIAYFCIIHHHSSSCKSPVRNQSA